MMATTSAAFSSTSTMMSRIRLRRMRFFSRASVCSSFHQLGGQSSPVFLRRHSDALLPAVVCSDLRLDFANPHEGLVPPSLEFIGQQPVVWVRLVVMLLGTLRAVPRCLQVALQRGGHFVELVRLLGADLDLVPAQAQETIAHGVLQALAFQVVTDLIGRGLAHVEHGLARKVAGANLVIHRRPPATRRPVAALRDRAASERGNDARQNDERHAEWGMDSGWCRQLSAPQPAGRTTAPLASRRIGEAV
jgi:hypothetical protein